MECNEKTDRFGINNASHVKPYICHHNLLVRELAMTYFAGGGVAGSAKRDDGSVMPLVVRACDEFGIDTLSDFLGLPRLRQTEDTLEWLLRTLSDGEASDDERSERPIEMISQAVASVEDELLFERKDEIRMTIREYELPWVEERLRLKDMEWPTIWSVFQRRVEHGGGYQFPLVSIMGRRADEGAAHIMARLAGMARGYGWSGQQNRGDLNMDVYLPMIAGEMQLDEAVPLLMGIATHPNATEDVLGAVADALFNIGGDQTVRAIETRWSSFDEDAEAALLEVPGHIHTPASIEFSRKHTGTADDSFLRAYLVDAALLHLDGGLIEPLRKIVLSGFDSHHRGWNFGLRDYVAAASIVTGQTDYAEFEEWSRAMEENVEPIMG